MVDPDGVGAEFRHAGDIPLALGGVNQRVLGRPLICDAFQEVLSAVFVEEFGADG